MTGLLAELGKKLAERWVALLVLPGLVFTVVAASAAILGQRSWADVDAIGRRFIQLTTTPSAPGDGLPRTALLLVALLVASFASGVLARGLATPVERVLSGRWSRPLHRLAAAMTRRRRTAWDLANQDWQRARDAGETDRLSELAERRNRIALVRPASATWIGDRFGAPSVRVHQEYGLDLPATWSRLWLRLPESTRVPLTESRTRVDDATALGGWALLYLVLGVVWWPAAVAGVVIGLVGWRRARAAVAVYADLVEAAVDVHLDGLLAQFVDERGVRPARPRWGHQLTERFRKGI
jgi:hypothetical protein